MVEGVKDTADPNIDKIVLQDLDIEQNEHFIKFVFIPYFRDIYTDLAQKSDKHAKGISKIIFTEVLLWLNIHSTQICLEFWETDSLL